MARASLVAIAAVAAAALATPAALAQTNEANGADNGAAATRMAGPGGALATISPSGVREVQQVLNRLGYFAGPINGVWDRLTADALLHFQEAHGLEPTGNLNFSSIAGLGLWENLIGHPIGPNNNLLNASTGAPPPRGKGKTVIGGEPLPSQRLTTTGGGVTGSNTSLGARSGPGVVNGTGPANAGAANGTGATNGAAYNGAANNGAAYNSGATNSVGGGAVNQGVP
jgi:Putative peptidoglycan binding domain